MRLTAERIFTKTRQSDLSKIITFNSWGSDLSDVSILRELVNVEIITLTINNVATLEPLKELKKLRGLYMRKNNIADLGELDYLKNLPKLTELWLCENPCCKTDGPQYRLKVIKALPQLTILDGVQISEKERLEANQLRDPDIESPSNGRKSPLVYDDDTTIPEEQLNKRHTSQRIKEQGAHSNLGPRDSPLKQQDHRSNHMDTRDRPEHSTRKMSENTQANPQFEENRPRDRYMESELPARRRRGSPQQGNETFSSRPEVGKARDRDDNINTPMHANTSRYKEDGPGPKKNGRTNSTNSNLLSAALGIIQELDENALRVLRGVVDSHINNIEDEEEDEDEAEDEE